MNVNYRETVAMAENTLDEFIYLCPAIDLFGEMTRVWNIRNQPVFIKDLIDKCQVLASNCVDKYGSSWEGDIRINEDGTLELYIFTLPNNEESQYGVCWKQENNGNTIVCSPFELPWLSEFLMEDQGSPL